MTREEKIAELINIRDNFNYALTPREVFDDAIKALEQQPVLDKIRNEIIQLIQNGVLKIESGNEALFDIIDKYNSEMRGDEDGSN
jgi:hypothetical protein